MALLNKIKKNLQGGLAGLVMLSSVLTAGCNLNKIGISPDKNKLYFALTEENKTDMESMKKRDTEIYELNCKERTLKQMTNNDVSDSWVDVSEQGIVYTKGLEGPHPKIIYTDLDWKNEKELGEGFWPLWWNKHVIYLGFEDHEGNKGTGIYITDLQKNKKKILSFDKNIDIPFGWPAILENKAYFYRVKECEREKKIGETTEKEKIKEYEIISINYKTLNQEVIAKISEEELRKDGIKDLGAVDLAVSNDEENIAICFVRNYDGGPQSGLYNLNKGNIELLFKHDWVYYPTFSSEKDLSFLVSDYNAKVTSIYTINLEDKDKVTRLVDLPGGMGGAATAYVPLENRDLMFVHICNEGLFLGDFDLKDKEGEVIKLSMEELIKIRTITTIKNEFEEIRNRLEKIKSYTFSEEKPKTLEDYKFEEPKEFKLSEGKEILDE